MGFDALERFMRIAPGFDLAQPGALLSHVRVPAVFDPRDTGGTKATVDVGGLAGAFREPDRFRELFGIDVAAMLEHTIVGNPPDNVAYVRIDRQHVGRLAQSLAKRGFERATLGADAVYARGSDNEMSFKDREPADPFWGDFGAAQRFLVRDDLVIVSRAWAPIRTAAAALDGPRAPVTGLLGAALPSIRGAVGAQASVDQAVAYGLVSLAGATMDREAMEAIAAGRAPRLPAGTTMPPFLAAWFMAGSQGKDAFAVVATLYGDEPSARQGGASIARRLQAFDSGGGPAPLIEARAAPAGSAWVGIVIVRFAGQPPERGVVALRAWNAAVMDRRFTPLDPLR